MTSSPWASSLDAFQNSIFNGGVGYDRISLTGFSGDDLGALKEQFSFDAKTQAVMLGSSTFSGFEEVQLGEDLLSVATDFVQQAEQPMMLGSSTFSNPNEVKQAEEPFNVPTVFSPQPDLV